jgi:hypothetical protein
VARRHTDQRQHRSSREPEFNHHVLLLNRSACLLSLAFARA